MRKGNIRSQKQAKNFKTETEMEGREGGREGGRSLGAWPHVPSLTMCKWKLSFQLVL